MAQNAWHWHELNCNKIDAASGFYEHVFGWSVEPMEFDGQPYRMLLSNGRPIGGVAPTPEGVDPGWSVFIGVADCDESRDRVLAAGGSVGLGPVTIPGVGRIAVCQDVVGASFTLIQPEAEGGAS